MWEITAKEVSGGYIVVYKCMSFTHEHSNILCLQDVDDVPGSITLVNLAAVFDVAIKAI